MAAKRRPAEDTERRVRDELALPWALSAPELEGIAQEAHDRFEAALARLPREHPWARVGFVMFPPPDMLAAVLGFIVVEDDSAHCGQAALIKGVLAVRPTRKAETHNLRVLHELAEELLRPRGRGRYEHSDAWALTLMLAIPRRLYRHRDLARHIPVWARRLRRALACVAERMAA